MKKWSIILSILLCSMAMGQVNSPLPLTLGRAGAAIGFNRNFDAIGINPANLGWSDNKLFSFGMLGFGWNVQSQTLNMSNISTLFLSGEKQITDEQKATFSNLFTHPEGLNYNFNMQWFGASVKIPKIGALAIALNSRTTSHIGLNDNAADIIFYGKDAQVFQDSSFKDQTVSQIFEGTNISYNFIREFNIAYGLKIINIGEGAFNVYAGAGYKYLWGMGHLRLQSENGDFTGLSSFSDNNSDIDYSGVVNFDPVAAQNLFNAPGRGHGFDLGGSISFGTWLKAGVSITDIGSIEWTTNVLVAKDTNLRQPSNDGSDNFSWKEQAKLIYSKDGVMTMREGESFTTKLPTRIRIGAALKPTEMFQIGFDLIAPFNDEDPSFDKATLAIGAQINLLGMVKFSSGVTFNEQYGTSIPVGLTFGLFGKLEAGIALGDVISIFDGEDTPNASAGLGMLRVNL